MRLGLIGLLAVTLAGTAFLPACAGMRDGNGGNGDAAGVTATGDVGEAPEITIPDGDPPAELQTEVLTEGEGAEVESGDLLVANYEGRLWEGGEVFDSSFERGAPAAFPIGTGGVIAGWDEGLVGQNVGSRVLLVVPPDKAYGEDGAGEDIPPNSSLVFVVDLVDAFSSDTSGDAELVGEPVADLPANLPEVTGELGSEPTIDVADTPRPRQSRSVLVASGSGGEIDGSSIVVRAVQQPWGAEAEPFSSWGDAPLAVSLDGIPGLADALADQEIGSRVVTLVSGEDNNGTPLALVLDVIGSF